MWEIKNRTPYSAASLWWRDQSGVHSWIVGIKASFEFTFDGEVQLLEEQEPVTTMPTYDGDPVNPSLLYEADILPMRPVTDVILNATAYAPNNRPAERFNAGFRVAEMSKKIELNGLRFWVSTGDDQLIPGPINTVPSVPVIWQNAIGGYYCEGDDPSRHKLEPRNPCGSGAFGALGLREGDKFPQVLNIDDPSQPEGLAAIPVHWQPRHRLVGTYDAHWEKNIMPLLPQDWKRESQQCAPADQQTKSYLRGGEPIELINLTPNGRVVFTLPKIGLTCLTYHDGVEIRHRPRLVCVIIEPDHFEDKGRIMIVWNSEISVQHEIDYLERTLIQERPYAT